MLEGVQEVVTGEMNASLVMEYKPEEVAFAIKEMPPLKGTGSKRHATTVLSVILARCWYGGNSCSLVLFEFWFYFKVN